MQKTSLNVNPASFLVGAFIVFGFVQILSGLCVGAFALATGWIIHWAAGVLEMSEIIGMSSVQIGLVLLGLSILIKRGMMSTVWYAISIALMTAFWKYVGTEIDTAMIIALFFYTTIVMKSVFETNISLK